MANAIYPKYKEALLTNGSTNIGLNADDATDGPFCALIDSAVAPYNAAHDFFDDIAAGVVGAPVQIATPSVINGIFDGSDLTFSSVTGATVESLVIHRHTSAANSTWRLVAWLDASISGLPVAPNGGNITVTWFNGPPTAGIIGL